MKTYGYTLRQLCRTDNCVLYRYVHTWRQPNIKTHANNSLYIPRAMMIGHISS